MTITPPSFMKFCPVVPEIVDKFMCHGKKERMRIIIIIRRRRNGAKTISLQTLFGRLKYPIRNTFFVPYVR
jgi:uncharacterized protein (UPF0248 family)